MAFFLLQKIVKKEKMPNKIKVNILLGVFLLGIDGIFAQLPPACPVPNPPLAKTCSQACVLCNLDGYTSTTTQGIQGQVIPGFCTMVVHSMGYIGFVAGSTDLTIEVSVGACTQGNSIEMGIYQTDDCQNFTLVSDCNTAMFTGNAYVFSNIAPLVPGCPYFLVFDNNGPAACAFTVTVLSGSATAPAVGMPAVPSGPTSVCPGATATYTIPPVYGACHYRWSAPAGATINGLPSPVTLPESSGTTVTVTWGNQGGQLCVQGVNPCHSSPTACLPVTVAPIPPTILPPLVICAGESVDWIDGNTYNSSQLLSVTYQTSLGCDSVVRQMLTVLAPIVKNLGLQRICEGDCLTVGGNPYCNNGSFQEVLTAESGCDSTVFFSVLVIEAHALIAAPDTLTCLQSSVALNGTGSTAGSVFTWLNPAGTVISNMPAIPVNTPGLYHLIIQRSSGGITCYDTASATVVADVQAPGITALGDTLTCYQPAGLLTGSSPTPNVVFQWTGPGGFITSVPNPTVSQPGIYTLSVSGTNGCQSQDSVVLLADLAEPSVTLTPSAVLSCHTDSVQLQTILQPANVVLLWSGPQNISSGQSNPFVTAAGMYSVIAIGLNGCADTAAAFVAADTTVPSLAVTGGNLSCLQNTVTLSANVVPDSCTIVWSGPQGFSSGQSDPQVGIPGMYTALATASNGCMASDSVVVFADTIAPQLVVTGGALNCFQPQVTLSANFLPAGSTLLWTGPQNFSSTQNNPTVTVPGVYLATVTGPNHCTTSAAATVSADASIPVVTAVGGVITCTNSAVTLTSAISPAGSAAQWSGPQNFSSSLPNPTVLFPGDYTITVTTPNGCSATTVAAVTADTIAPMLSADGGVITCLQPAVTIIATTAPGIASLLWSGPQNFSATTSDTAVTAPGIYTVLAQLPNGCTATATATVFEDTTPPQITVSGGTLTCLQNSVGLNAVLSPATAGVMWSGPQNFSSSLLNPGVNTAGTYVVTATSPNGCTAVSGTVVAADTLPPQVIATGGTITCTQPAVFLSAQIFPAGSTAFWSGPQNFSSTLINPEVMLAGNYAVVATAPNGCTAQTATTIIQDTAAPSVSASGGLLTCLQDSLILAASVFPPNSALSWTGPSGFVSTQLNPVVIVPGAYVLTATSGNGCTGTAIAPVNADSNFLQVTAAGGTITCSNSNISLSASVTPAGSTVSWSGPQNFTSNQINPVVDQAGTYLLIATTTNGCSASIAVMVLVDTLSPQVTANVGNTLTCLQPVAGISAAISPAGSQVLWSGPQNFSATGVVSQVTNPGLYTATVTAPNGCTAVATAEVFADLAVPQVAVPGTTITCIQTSSALTAAISPPGGMWSLVWSGPQNFSSPLPSPLVSIPGVYTLVVTGSNGCSATASAAVLADTISPQVSAAGGSITCEQSSVNLSASISPSGSSIQWTGPQNFMSVLANPAVSAAGVYSITASSANGCTAVATTIVSADTLPPAVSASGTAITCLQGTAFLSAAITPPGSTVEWSGPQNFTSGQINPTTTTPGTYTVIATGANGCSASAGAEVLAQNQPNWLLSLGPDLLVEELEWVFPKLLTSLPSNEQAGIVWEYPVHVLNQPCTSCPFPGFRLRESGEIIVYLTDQFGCTLSDSLFIRVQQTGAIYVPNIFAPASETGNQLFGIQAGSEALVTRIRSFRIFDRWGSLVHEVLDFDPADAGHGWDGSYRGKEEPPGVYGWYAEVLFENGARKILKGDVTLVR